MRGEKPLLSDPYFFFAAGIATSIALLVWALTGMHLTGDAGHYLAALDWLQGGAPPVDTPAIPADLVYCRLLRPLTILLVAPAASLIGALPAFALVNITFIAAAAGLLYRFAARVMGDRRTGLLAAVLYATSFPVLFMGIAPLAEAGTQFFIILIMYIGLALPCSGEDTILRRAALTGALCGTGMLMKETVVSGLVFCLLRVFFCGSRKDRVKTMIVLAASCMAVFASAQAVIWLVTGYGFQDWVAFNTAMRWLDLFPVRLMAFYLICAAGAFGWSLPFAVAGAASVTAPDGAGSRVRTDILLYAAVAAALVLLVTVSAGPEVRFLFTLFPAVLPLAAEGMGRAAVLVSGRRESAAYLPVLALLVLLHISATAWFFSLFYSIGTPPLFNLVSGPVFAFVP
jgi:4-amino-4-deoxy-L-arabinose transferase-like glycosyltransferase